MNENQEQFGLKCKHCGREIWGQEHVEKIRRKPI
jgi:hypothetical protein